MESKLEHANSILFGDLCNLLEQLYMKKLSVQEKEKKLSKYILDFKCNVAKGKVDKKNSSFYPILRLLVPSYERERGAYNLKEHKLGDLLVKVLSLNRQSHDAQKLLNRALNSQDADFGNIAYFILKSRVSQTTCNLTIGDINETLDKIASAEVGNKRFILDDLFSKIIRNLTPEQTKWFLRIILKDLKLAGMSAKRILSCYHPDAPEHYEKFQNLAKVCEELEDGNVRPLELGIELFYAVSPMLSERLDVTDIGRLPAGKTYQIEEKFDGERFQIHMESKASDDPNRREYVYEYFSRKGFTYWQTYGRTYESGLLTPQLKHCFSSQVTSFVLDGEMMGWHKQRQCFGSKGMAFDVKKITEKSRFQPCFVAFDILYFNGRSLVGPEEQGGMKLSERLKLLDAMFIDVPGVIQHSKRKMVTKSSDILAALNKAIDNQDEGIVVKDVDSYYIANKRNAGWYKIKPEYTDGVMDDLDLVVVGVDAADNPRHGLAKSFLVALADTEPGGVPHRWICVGRVATGLSYDERESLCTLLQKHWNLARQQHPPSSLVFNKIKPDFWILPEHSVVLQVRATELIRSTDFGTPYTLRFPRIKRLRDDKPVNDIMTLLDLNRLVESAGPVVKLSNKRVGEELIEGEAKPRKKRITNLPEVPDALKKTTAGDVEVTSQALKGRKIYIINDDDDCDRGQLIRIVESHAGRVVANPGMDTWVQIAGRLTYRVRKLIAQGEADVASTAWLRNLQSSPAPVSLAPLDLLAMKRETRLACARDYDAFGDSYIKHATEDSLKRCLQKMDKDEPEVYLTTQEMLQLDRELFGDNNPFSFLRPCYIHITAGKTSLLAIRCRMFAATTCDIDDSNITHVVVSKTTDPEKVQEIKQRLDSKTAVVVSEEWLEKCFALEKLVSDTVFIL